MKCSICNSEIDIQHCEKCNNEIIKTITEEVLESEKDTRRLNWLAERCYLPYEKPPLNIFVIVSEEAAPLGKFTCNIENDRKALREAIDKYMKE